MHIFTNLGTLSYTLIAEPPEGDNFSQIINLMVMLFVIFLGFWYYYPRSKRGQSSSKSRSQQTYYQKLCRNQFIRRLSARNIITVVPLFVSDNIIKVWKCVYNVVNVILTGTAKA